MNFEIEFILLAVLVMLWMDVMIVLRTLSNKSNLALSQERRQQELSELPHLFEIDATRDRKKLKRLFDNYLQLRQSIILPEAERARILALAGAERKRLVLERRLRYRNRYDRMDAAMGLSLIGGDKARLALERALATEKDFPVKLYMANALADIKDPRSIEALVSSLLGAHRWYRDKVNMLIASFGNDAVDYLQGYAWRGDSEIIELFVDLASQSIHPFLKEYVADLVHSGQETMGRLAAAVRGCADRSCAYCIHGTIISDDLKRLCPFEGKVEPGFRCRRFRLLVTSQNPVANHRRLVVKAAECLEKYYGEVLDTDDFLEHSDKDIRAIAVRSLGNGSRERNIEQLLHYIEDDATSLAARMGLSHILSVHPRLVPSVVDAFMDATRQSLRQSLAEVLAGRIEYFISRLATREAETSNALIRQVLALGKVSEIIEFLKVNQDEELEDAVCALIRDGVTHNNKLRMECGIYLPERLLEKCGIARVVLPSRKREEKRDWKMIRGLYLILAFSIALFPLFYLIRYSNVIRQIPFIAQLKTFVVDFNYDFAYYSLAVNFVYLALLALSVFKVRTSSKLWNLKTMSLLFKPRMLPSVSIIAPAYNEEKTIIESANSLLNLKYPDCELLIVNDGSKDNTLNTLITHFDLKRADYFFTQRLKTAPVRGVYLNPMYPRLKVVDKENGGKADTLNAGLNIASKEYFCGIDADSLLEPDALLKVASLTLDYGVETPALGGNVFPINGCTVDRGKLTSIALPAHNLARLQTIEYLRAFMCGRLGWAQLNSLLIISGAFGLFRKERVVSIGGYLTSNERFGKDTVGEDMELVVRIARLMREKKQKYRISYAFNANCWTEVPETMQILKRQRDRWHRGLIDIMFFHRKILFNPAYGKMGFLGMPYFLVFEMVGPLFEIQGYLMVALAALFGLISTKLALLLFVSTIFMGVLISMASVLIAERQLYYFNYRDTLRMLVIALVENFGPRQLFSLWRVLGYISAMKRPKGWGKMERKGFSGGPGNQGTGKAAGTAAEAAAQQRALQEG
jgi:cellulose synthase/poly-beta-1,6-N-acetylglucosamine synthase-like glycosyltransferase/HEAT repeat protein